MFETHVIHVQKGLWTSLSEFPKLGRRHKHLILVLRRGRTRPVDFPSLALLLSGFWPWGDIKWQELASNTQRTGVTAIEMWCILPFATHVVENRQQRETWTIFWNNAVDRGEVYPKAVGGSLDSKWQTGITRYWAPNHVFSSIRKLYTYGGEASKGADVSWPLMAWINKIKWIFCRGQATHSLGNHFLEMMWGFLCPSGGGLD